jgi:hypothetical protein
MHYSQWSTTAPYLNWIKYMYAYFVLEFVLIIHSNHTDVITCFHFYLAYVMLKNLSNSETPCEFCKKLHHGHKDTVLPKSHHQNLLSYNPN